MFMNKGQVTIFIIIGIVMLAAAGLAFYLMGLDASGHEFSDTPAEFQPIVLFAQGCLKDALEIAIFENGKRGMYYDLPVTSEVLFGIEFNQALNGSPNSVYSIDVVPKYVIDGMGLFPTLDVVESQLAMAANDSFFACISGFEGFEGMGFMIEGDDQLKLDVTIAKNEVIAKATGPLTIGKDTKQKTIDTFSQEIRFDLLGYYGLVSSLVEEQQKVPDYIPLGYLTNLAYENGFTFETSYLQGDNVLYSLVFTDDNYPDRPFIYSFIMQYGWNGFDGQNEVSIEPIPAFTLNESTGIFHYQVNATGNNLTFSDNTALFDIEPKTGVIMFDASYMDEGEHIILIRAEDENGNKDFEYMRLVFVSDDLSPKIEPIGELTAYAGQEFVYQVKAIDTTDSYLAFLDDTSLFDIHPLTGEIRFTPALKGNYSIKITAANSEGHAFEQMRLEVR